MPGISRLTTTIMELNGTITSKKSLAESLQNNAQTHLDAGDEVTAQSEQSSADRYLQEVEDLQNKVASMEALILAKQQQKNGLAKQIDELNRNHEQQLKKLQSELDSLS